MILFMFFQIAFAVVDPFKVSADANGDGTLTQAEQDLHQKIIEDFLYQHRKASSCLSCCERIYLSNGELARKMFHEEIFKTLNECKFVCENEVTPEKCEKMVGCQTAVRYKRENQCYEMPKPEEYDLTLLDL
eukprot:snap_masked-scaffold_14-processed-gene-3.52-mRNA-1 protein AED:1.00 eAED:1.00 QI:0/-1/0/0/-1/1/1/0/131